MNTQITKTRSDNTLENLDPKQREWILEIAGKAESLLDMVKILKEEGIETSKSTLGRFLQKHRQKCLMDEKEDAKATVEQLAASAKEGKLREGTLEMVRQRLFERALVVESPEEARELHAALVKEEAKLRELELEARRVAIAEEQLKLDALVARSKLAGKVKGEVIDANAKSEPLAIGSGEVKEAKEVKEVKQIAGRSEHERRLEELIQKAVEILNRGGYGLEERLLEARDVLAEGVKEIEVRERRDLTR